VSKKFVILDGSSLIYRAFYAMPPLTDSKGEATGAMVGFDNMLTKLLAELSPELLAIAFDRSRHTFRTERYADYKGTRKETPAELKTQIPLLKEYAKAYGIAFLEKDNYEADDIIGTLATQAALGGFDTIVVTGDRDALQLVRPNLRVMLTKKGISEIKLYDEVAFEEEYGFEPVKLIDLKGLMGDTSDNIPGVPGVGLKTASKLLLEYGSLEAVLENADKVSGKKLQEKLLENKEQALLSKELATIELAVPDMAFKEEMFAIEPGFEAMEAFCKAHELNKVWQNFQRLNVRETSLFTEEQETAPADLSYRIAAKAAEFEACLKEEGALGLAGVFSGRHPFERLEGGAVVCGKVKVFVPFGTPAWEALLQALESGRQAVVFDAKRYYQAGLSGVQFFDVQLVDYLLRPELSDYELGRLAGDYFPREAVPEAFADEQEEAAWQAGLLARLREPLWQELTERQQERLYADMELPLVAVLADMEQQGIFVNRQRLLEKAEEVGQKIEAIQADIYTLAGGEFKINSPKQLGEVLFERLGLPPVKKTKTGYSTNAEVLETLRYQHPIVELVLAFRMWSKLKSTYLDGIADLIDGETGRVHTTFNQTVTATGRLSSSDPNLQNIPVRREEGKTIRALFEPGEGYDYLLSADYSQIELRILAHMSGDESFLEAFREDQDIHARTAAEVFGVTLDEVTAEMRRKAKAVNFGIVYGISDYGLSRDLHISRQEAAGYIASYFDRYPGVKAYLDRMVQEAKDTGSVKTLFGRRRELPAITSRNFNQRSLAERMAMNTPIQGTAADIIKAAMVRVAQRMEREGLSARLLLQVHDELIVECPEDEAARVQSLLTEEMEHVADFSVPLTVDAKVGKTWAEAH